MAFDFPSSPTDGQTYTPAGGPTYTYNAAGTKWLVTGTGLSGVATASQAEQEAGTATDKAVTPGVQQHHRSAAKVWAEFNIAGSIDASYNVTSITDNGTGSWNVVIGTDFSSISYAGFAFGGLVAGVSGLFYHVNAQSGALYNIASYNPAGTLTDPTSFGINFVAFGDQ